MSSFGLAVAAGLLDLELRMLLMRALFRADWLIELPAFVFMGAMMASGLPGIALLVWACANSFRLRAFPNVLLVILGLEAPELVLKTVLRLSPPLAGIFRHLLFG